MSPPSLATSEDETVYLDNFGLDLGICYREARVGTTDLDTVINDLSQGQYEAPVRVIAFNLQEGWSKDVSADIARKLQHLAELKREDFSSTIEDFVARNIRDRRQFTE